MITMMTLGNDITVMYTSTPVERAMREEISLVLAHEEVYEGEDLPTYEPTGIGRHINTLVDTGLNQRTSPKYNFTSRNRDRR